jgi:hypothetical protein
VFKIFIGYRIYRKGGCFMKSSKSRLIIVAAVFLFVALGCSITAKGVEQPGARQSLAASSAALPLAKPPVLRIGGEETPDVYLQSLDIQVEVTGNIASTRYTMVFKNRTDRVLEGELTFPLPDGRTVTHYALDINGNMREAVPVEKARATQVFEEIQRREVDPGILERVEGNNFRTRIYPFPRQGTRTISIGYEEELPLENNLLYYRLPMAYASPLEKFSVKATVWKSNLAPLVPEDENEIRFDRAGENYVAAFARENYQPARALIFALPAPAEIPRVMMQSAQGSFYFLASVAPNLNTRKKRWGDDLAIIWDVSLSGSQRNLQREMEALDIIFAEKKNANVHLYFLNNELEKITNQGTRNGEFRVANRNWDGLKNVLERAVFDGGTNFSKIDLSNIAGNEILFFSDGISTLSDANFLNDSNVNRPVHCIVSSAKADYSAMRLIAGRTRGKFVNINALSSQGLRDELLNETPQFLGTEHGEVLREVYPGIAMPVHGNFSVAGISDVNDAEMTLLFGFSDRVEKRIKVKLDARTADNQGNIYRIWAQKKIAELDLEYEKKRAELTELGQQFGIVTRNTSLIVLELVEDYLHYGIEPPDTDAALYAEYQRGLKMREERQRDTEGNLLNLAVAAADTLKRWWNTDFTPRRPKFPTPDNSRSTRSSGSERTRTASVESGSARRSRSSSTTLNSPSEPPPPPPPPNRVRTNSGFDFESAEVIGYLDNPTPIMQMEWNEPRAIANDGRGVRNISQPESVITIKRGRQDNDYLNKLTGKVADDYQIYLNLRNDYTNLPTFYFDMADWFYRLGDRETALRVLTSIAELELENASLYRLLGYRFKEYGEHALQKFVCWKLIQWRPMEPQSYRDYALALADNGEAQAALDSLSSLLTRSFPSANIGRRSRGIEEAIVTEINRLITRYPNLNTSNIDKRLIINIPVDIRVVINWNMNNVDIDLHVRDPNNEMCYYGNRRTRIGGRLSDDNRGGYGPEQFMLKRAIRGKYQVYVNYFSDREFTPDGPSTVMAEIFTRYADQTEQRQVVSLQLSNVRRESGRRGSGNANVQVAEFEF